MSVDNTSLKIRPLLARDIDVLAQIMAETPLWQRYGVDKARAALRLQSGLCEQAAILVAELDHTPVGFVWFVEKGAFNRSGYIMLIAVEGTVRGKRIGEALMAQAEAQLFAHNQDVFLLVSDFNLEAQRFYQRLGYVQVGAIPDYVVVGITELIFHKRRLTVPAPLISR